MINFKLQERTSFNYASKFFFISVILILFACNSSNHSKEKETNYSSPNFILILADDQGWNGTSVKMMYNEPGSKSDYFETPNLEQLSQRGMRFSDAYSSAPVCAPSRYSIQFGKTPARLSLIRVGMNTDHIDHEGFISCLLYTSPSPRDLSTSRMPSSA